MAIFTLIDILNQRESIQGVMFIVNILSAKCLIMCSEIKWTMLKRLFGCLLLVAGLQACYYDNEHDLYPVVPGNGCDTATVSYAATIQPIMQTRCVSCHSGGFPSGGLGLTTHAEVAGSVDRIIDRITRNEGDALLMPQGAKMDACRIDQIIAWANQGALNN
jgi:hypothetical protein